MTRRSSVRAQARRNYCALTRKTGPHASDPTSHSSPRVASARGGGEQKVETKLTKRVRALYEDSAVPVREIARLAGVTERTLYKYVERHGWKKRYRVLPPKNLQGLEAAARVNRGRSLQPLPDVAPVKGAGGRFIRRDDKDKPVAVGLKATDPVAAKRAAASCGGAAHLSALAQADAEAAQRFEQRIRAIEFTNIALTNWRKHREERVRKGLSASPDRIEPLLMKVVKISADRWEALLAGGRART